MIAKLYFDLVLDISLSDIIKYFSFERNIDCLCLFSRINLKDVHGHKIYARVKFKFITYIDTYLSNMMRLVDTKTKKILYSYAIDHLMCGLTIL